MTGQNHVDLLLLIPQAGMLSYLEICMNIKAGGWTVVQDPTAKRGPYAYKVLKGLCHKIFVFAFIN